MKVYAPKNQLRALKVVAKIIFFDPFSSVACSAIPETFPTPKLGVHINPTLKKNEHRQKIIRRPMHKAIFLAIHVLDMGAKQYPKPSGYSKLS